MSNSSLPSTAATLQPGTLWSAVLERCRTARASGALSPIECDQDVIDDAGVRFVVRRVSTLARKTEQRHKKRNTAPSSAREFPLEPALFVGNVSETHVALLNKFPVIAHHALLVTRRFVPQEALLDRDDFAALVVGLREFDALGFYNGGVAAGASQPHKHLQLVPLPLGSDRAVPMDALLERSAPDGRVTTVPGLPFRHAFCRCDTRAFGGDERLAARYRELLAAAGIGTVAHEGVACQSAPYNLLVTREWMLLVARTREHFGRISINALGYAGSIFVKNDDELAQVRDAGPMAVVKAVAAATPGA